MTNQQFTEKSREALAAAQQLTIEYQNQEVTQEHLAYALLSDAQGLIPQLLTKMGKRPQEIASRLETMIARLPKVTGGGREPDKIYISNDVEKALVAARDLAQRMKDEYLSVEHLFLGLLEKPTRAMADLWRGYAIDEKSFLPAFRPVKHWQREILRKLKVWSAPADSTIPKPPRSKRNAECSPRISAACSPWIWIPS